MRRTLTVLVLAVAMLAVAAPTLEHDDHPAVTYDGSAPFTEAGGPYVDHLITYGPACWLPWFYHKPSTHGRTLLYTLAHSSGPRGFTEYLPGRTHHVHRLGCG